jgi:hypothetical protein
MIIWAEKNILGATLTNKGWEPLPYKVMIRYNDTVILLLSVMMIRVISKVTVSN